MCIGGSLLAEFVAGSEQRPNVPEVVEPHLTLTADGAWVVWARKAARRSRQGAGFVPLTGGGVYPRDAVASCRRDGDHDAPDRSCTCGFHALANAPLPTGVGIGFDRIVCLDVALSGRVRAFTWPSDDAPGGGMLFRAERQTVVRETSVPRFAVIEPEFRPRESGGRTARLISTQPQGAGPRRLRLPQEPPPCVAIDDDAGYCRLVTPAAGPALAPA